MPCCFFLLANISFAQTEKRDTLEFYKKIKRIAYKHRATIFLYHSIFVDPAPEKYEKKPLSDEQKIKNPNKKFGNKIIRNITIEVYDPFGYSVNDTLHREVHTLQKIANKYHVKTQHYVIRNLLLFKKNDTIDLIKIDESERLLRSMSYINDAHIYVFPAGVKSDSVDVKILVKDKWAVNVPFTIYPFAGNFSLKDRNILGSGQAFTQYFGYSINPNVYDVKGNYFISNIRNSFISANFFYETRPSSTQAGFSFDRPFYSPLAKWAGGISANKTWSYLENESSLAKNKYLVHTYNYDNWYAKSFTVNKDLTRNARLGKLIVAARCAATIYEKRPPAEVDPEKIYSNSSMNIGSIGFSLNKFYKDQFIYRFGANEDIPEGIILQLVNGVTTNEYKGIGYYNGFEFSGGKHFNNFGYFSGNTSYGVFFNKNVSANTTLNTRFFYFSDIVSMKKWYLRQFVYYKYVAGFNKGMERIGLNPEEMYGFNRGSVSGTSKMLLNLETVIYSPYILVGFRFAPLVLAGLGTTGNPHETILLKREIYQAYALGILIRNENFLVNSFQFTLGYYPNLPGGNKNFLQLNPVASFTLKVRNFAISKPGPVAFE